MPSDACVKVLSLQRERVRVILKSKVNSPNSITDTKHNETSAAFDVVVHMDAVVTNTR